MCWEEKCYWTHQSLLLKDFLPYLPVFLCWLASWRVPGLKFSVQISLSCINFRLKNCHLVDIIPDSVGHDSCIVIFPSKVKMKCSRNMFPVPLVVVFTVLQISHERPMTWRRSLKSVVVLLRTASLLITLQKPCLPSELTNYPFFSMYVVIVFVFTTGVLIAWQNHPPSSPIPQWKPMIYIQYK